MPIGGIGAKPLSPAIFEIMGIKHIRGHDLDLHQSLDNSIWHMPFPISGPLVPSISSRFWDIGL